MISMHNITYTEGRLVIISLTNLHYDYSRDYVQAKTVIGRAQKQDLLCIIVLVKQSQLLRSCT